MLFCDEPTTGLDSYSAMVVVRILREVAARGRVVICSLHQPASGLLDLFHEILLISSGRVAFQGPSSDATSFFDRYKSHSSLPNHIFSKLKSNHFIYLIMKIQPGSPLSSNLQQCRILRLPIVNSTWKGNRMHEKNEMDMRSVPKIKIRWKNKKFNWRNLCWYIQIFCTSSNIYKCHIILDWWIQKGSSFYSTRVARLEKLRRLQKKQIYNVP